MSRCAHHGEVVEGQCIVCWKAEADRHRSALLAVRRLIRPGNPCHDGMREVLLDALNTNEPEEGTDG